MYQRPGSVVSVGVLFLSAFFGVHCGPTVDSYCSSVGPPCGLSVDYEGNLDVGTYLITVETPEGLTTCDYEVVEPVRQSASEAEAQDEALADCADNGTCPEACTGPTDVTVSRGGVRVDGDAADVTVTVENVGTGAFAEESFAPSYEDHPEECADCVTASASMPLPAL